MKILYRIWCEWDLGFERYIFFSEDIARKWLEKNWDKENPLSMEECLIKGLVGFEQATLIEEVE